MTPMPGASTPFPRARGKAGMGAATLLLAALALPASAAPPCEPDALYVVRHAQKAAGADPDVELSEAGRATASALVAWFNTRNLDRVYATHLRRTQQTAMPVAQAARLDLRVLPAGDTATLIEHVQHACGEAVLVVGHSNTVPEIAGAFGAAPFAIDESQFGTVWFREDGVWKSEAFVPEP